MKLLNEGYINLIEKWGTDERIIESARMSTNKGFQGWEKDEKLLKFLYENKHLTPFEMCGMTIEVQAPIFVFREWHRHRTQSYNELSARYTELPNLFYVPTIERMMNAAQDNINKQGSKLGFDSVTATKWNESIENAQKYTRIIYDQMIQAGVAKEIARLVIPVSQYSRMRASANLRNWMQFLTLRMAPNAQWEIRQYANALAKIMNQEFPRTYNLFIGEK